MSFYLAQVRFSPIECITINGKSAFPRNVGKGEILLGPEQINRLALPTLDHNDVSWQYRDPDLRSDGSDFSTNDCSTDSNESEFNSDGTLKHSNHACCSEEDKHHDGQNCNKSTLTLNKPDENRVDFDSNAKHLHGDKINYMIDGSYKRSQFYEEFLLYHGEEKKDDNDNHHIDSQDINSEEHFDGDDNGDDRNDTHDNQNDDNNDQNDCNDYDDSNDNSNNDDNDNSNNGDDRDDDDNDDGSNRDDGDDDQNDCDDSNDGNNGDNEEDDDDNEEDDDDYEEDDDINNEENDDYDYFEYIDTDIEEEEDEEEDEDNHQCHGGDDHITDFNGNNTSDDEGPTYMNLHDEANKDEDTNHENTVTTNIVTLDDDSDSVSTESCVVEATPATSDSSDDDFAKVDHGSPSKKTLFDTKITNLPLVTTAYQKTMAFILQFSNGVHKQSAQRAITAMLPYLNKDIQKILNEKLMLIPNIDQMFHDEKRYLKEINNDNGDSGDDNCDSDSDSDSSNESETTHRSYDIDFCKLNVTLPWDEVKSEKAMIDMVFNKYFQQLFGFGTRITVHPNTANTSTLKKKFSVGQVDNPRDPKCKEEVLKKFPYVPVEYTGEECVLCRSPVEIAIPKKFAPQVIDSLNKNDNHNLELRDKWDLKHVAISVRSVMNNPPTLGALIRAIIESKVPFVSIVTFGLRMKFLSRSQKNNRMFKDSAQREGKCITCILVLNMVSKLSSC